MQQTQPSSTAALITLKVFLPWYVARKPAGIVKDYIAYCDALNEIFSFGFLLRTLVSPWKGITDNYPKRGLDLSMMGQAFVLNMMSRLIGCIFRLVTIAAGVIAQVCCLVFFACYLLVWIAFPLLAAVALGYVLHTL